MELTSYAINENMTHVLRIFSVVIVFSNYVFLEHKIVTKELVY